MGERHTAAFASVGGEDRYIGYATKAGSYWQGALIPNDATGANRPKFGPLVSSEMVARGFVELAYFRRRSIAA